MFDFIVLNNLGRPIIAVGVAILFFLVPFLLKRMLRRFITPQEDSDLFKIVVFLDRAFQIICFIMGILSILGGFGVNLSAVFASLGLAGFGLGLALRDLISNLISGISIILYRPFLKGDKIFVAGSEGIVKEINLRYVVIENEEAQFMVPNSTFLNAAVKKFKVEK